MPPYENLISASDLNDWKFLLDSGVSPLSETEIRRTQVMTWTQHKEAWGIARYPKSPPPRRRMTRVDDLQPNLYPWQCYCWLDIRCRDLDEKMTKAVNQHRDILNHEFVKQWLSELPVSAKQVYLGLQNGTALVDWETFVEHWDTFSVLGNRLNVADDTSAWQLFFHPDDFAVFCCTDDFYYGFELESKGLVSASMPFQEKLKAAGNISRAYCADYVAEIASAFS